MDLENTWHVRKGKKHCAVDPSKPVVDSREKFIENIRNKLYPGRDFTVDSRAICPNMVSGVECNCKQWIHIKKCIAVRCKRSDCGFYHGK